MNLLTFALFTLAACIALIYGAYSSRDEPLAVAICSVFATLMGVATVALLYLSW